MKKFVFKLQRLYDVKNREEETAKKELERLSGRLGQLMDEKSSLKVKYIEEGQSYAHACEVGTKASVMQEYGAFFAYLIQKMQTVERSIIETQRMMDQVRVVLIRLMNEKKVLDRMRKEQFDIYKKEIAKSEDRELEDFMSGNAS